MIVYQVDLFESIGDVQDGVTMYIASSKKKAMSYIKTDGRNDVTENFLRWSISKHTVNSTALPSYEFYDSDGNELDDISSYSGELEGDEA